MVEVGIPVYKALDTLSKGLDSLVAQTYSPFLVCLSIDGDGLDYSQIIETYRNRGLHIRVINSKENEGPGMARQKIIDTTQCDYIMFMDADDMFMPRAVEVLYNGAKKEQYDILRSSFIKESPVQSMVIPADTSTITWFHGKIYRTKYLKDKNIRFHPTLRVEEDAYFNVLAWNAASLRGDVNEVTYIWRYNKQSITRADGRGAYFKNTYLNFIFSQTEALKMMPQIIDKIYGELVIKIFIRMYNHYQEAVYYNLSLKEMDNMIHALKTEQWIQTIMFSDEAQTYAIKNMSPGSITSDNKPYFYEEPFNKWLKRLLT